MLGENTMLLLVPEYNVQRLKLTTICTGNPRSSALMADVNNPNQTNDKFGHADRNQ